MGKLVGRYIVRFKSVDGNELMLYFRTIGATPHLKALIRRIERLLRKKGLVGGELESVKVWQMITEIWRIKGNKNSLLRLK